MIMVHPRCSFEEATVQKASHVGKSAEIGAFQNSKPRMNQINKESWFHLRVWSRSLVCHDKSNTDFWFSCVLVGTSLQSSPSFHMSSLDHTSTNTIGVGREWQFNRGCFMWQVPSDYCSRTLVLSVCVCVCVGLFGMRSLSRKCVSVFVAGAVVWSAHFTAIFLAQSSGCFMWRAWFTAIFAAPANAQSNIMVRSDDFTACPPEN